MATSITDLAGELQEMTEWQRTPVPLSLEDYTRMVTRGLERLYVDTARASAFHKDMIRREDDESVTFSEDLLVDEKLYVLICAQIDFFKKVGADVNNIVGYTTDALSITNADKPYANIKDSIASLEKERRITYYKMARYAM